LHVSARPTAPSEFDVPLTGLGETSFDDVPEEQTVELPAELGDDPRIALRRVLGMFATGVTVITTREGDQAHGMTANAFMSVSLEPPLVLISVDRRTKMCALLYGGRNFGVSVLSDGQSALSDRFAGRPTAAAPEPRFEVVRDTPLVDGALAHFVASIVRSYWGGDHSLFLGLVQYARYTEGTPLLFHGGRYERLTASPQDQ
jgi:flavin reductase (DIM6/NTAB) family NADH-FMN oxidoreductase RutF